MITVLVFAFNLSEITMINSEQYTNLKVTLPGPIGDILNIIQSSAPDLDEILVSPAESCESYINTYCASTVAPVENEGDISPATRSCLSDLPQSDLDVDCINSLNFWSAERENQDADIENDEEGSDESSSNSIINLRWGFNRYFRSPLPIPTFDQFVGAGTLLTNSLDDETYNELLNNNEYGRMWGNLFTLGTMHVVPSGPLADDFIGERLRGVNDDNN